jgi:tRNA 5-methylaminomethyl-2-thiouridine biosynthesis bifunctional protein
MSEAIDWRDGQPWSRRYGDVYFSREGGLGQARHVFLAGNRLPERFAALPANAHFTIAETGFGTGLSFLAAWQLFEQAAPPSAQLHFFSTERHPLDAAQLAAALSHWPELAERAAALSARTNALPPGWHRCMFAGGRVRLTLLVGDACETLGHVTATADAWFLDGFTPARNPDMWSDALLAQVARLSRRGTTCATWASSGVVRRALATAGFSISRSPGFGTKWEMVRGEFAGRDAPVCGAPWLRRPPALPDARDAVVIGGGLAGTAAAASLAARGLTVTLLDRRPALAAEASGNAQGVLYIKPSAHGTALTDLSLSGLAFTRRELARRLPADNRAWSDCGVLALAADAAEADRQAALAALGWPPGFLRAVDAAEASALAGVALPSGGLFYGTAGWAHPPAVCAAFADHARITTRFDADVQGLQRDADGRWHVALSDGTTLDAAVVVVAGGLDTARLPPLAHLPLKAIRGQITGAAATTDSARLATVLCGESYVAPARDGRHWLGATFDIGDTDIDRRPADDLANLEALRALAPALAAALDNGASDAMAHESRAGIRCVTPDYLPIVGAVADADLFRDRFGALSRDATTTFDTEAPWLGGLFVSTGHGSRGLVTAPIAGELIASLITGEPLPLSDRVVQALSAARFLARALKRGLPVGHLGR